MNGLPAYLNGLSGCVNGLLTKRAGKIVYFQIRNNVQLMRLSLLNYLNKNIFRTHNFNCLIIQVRVFLHTGCIDLRSEFGPTFFYPIPSQKDLKQPVHSNYETTRSIPSLHKVPDGTQTCQAIDLCENFHIRYYFSWGHAPFP